MVLELKRRIAAAIKGDVDLESERVLRILAHYVDRISKGMSINIAVDLSLSDIAGKKGIVS